MAKPMESLDMPVHSELISVFCYTAFTFMKCENQRA